ncbi:MAG: uL22 family ribosomal protein, partial [bacterium]|nr:uL22 family ribosomal protein [bacterium]
MASTGTHKQPAAIRKEEAKKAIRASIDTYNQSPRKVRLVTELVKGKKVSEAVAALTFLPKRAALPIKKLIESAAATAKARGEDMDTLKVA